MSSRDDILRRLAAVQFEKPLPTMPTYRRNDENLYAQFKSAAESSGARVERVEERPVKEVILELYPEANRIGSGVSDFPATHVVNEASSHEDISVLDLFICRAELAVAENGALWITESAMAPRAALFATQHLVVIIDSTSIVSDMHDAYREIDVVKEGFGLFVCGPSKTADIEQSLVVGAHGPRSLAIVVVDRNK